MVDRADPYHAFVPAGSNEEVKVVEVTNFHWTTSGGSAKSQSGTCGMCSDSRQGVAEIPPGPPVTGHPVIHDSLVPGAPRHASVIKEVQKLVTELLIVERRVLGLDRVI